MLKPDQMGLNHFLQDGQIRISSGAARISGSTGLLIGTVPLTGSKSESNRALMLNMLSGGKVHVINLSAADDTHLMIRALEQVREGAPPERQGEGIGTPLQERPIRIDIGPAGTVMRFMTALLSITKGEFVLTGSERMKQRPIALLVDALQQLGARISYTEKTGYPPLSISGGFEQMSDRVRIAGDVSSQYLSALLMIAPVLPQGLHLEIEGKLTSRPYLTMTLDMLKDAGIAHNWQGNTISIAPQKFRATTLSVEPDWSAASYWYSLLALSGSGELFLPGLKSDSLQGDRAIAGIMEHFGVNSSFTEDGVMLKKVVTPSAATTGSGSGSGSTASSDSASGSGSTAASGPASGDAGVAAGEPEKPILLDFTECPDLAQTVIACAAALKMDMNFTGLHTLRIKETDRIAALQREIARFGVRLTEKNPENSTDTVNFTDTGHSTDPATIVYQLDTSGFHQVENPVFDTYEDHRMAMAFAPLVQVFGRIKINAPRVVEKSYPDFWLHLQSLGFKIN